MSTTATIYRTSAQVRARYGGVAEMTLWRWQRDERLRFPKPARRINGRRLWREADLDAWDQSEEAQVLSNGDDSAAGSKAA